MFAGKALACMDIESVMRYMLLLQGAGMTDNVFNNMIVWARHENGKVAYHFIPWDMDNSLGARSSRIGSEFDRWVYFPAADRMLNLDVGGMRQRLYDMWRTLRADAWSLENIDQRVNAYMTELNESGAALRNAQRWELEVYVVDGYDLVSFVTTRFAILDQVLQKIAQHDGPVEMLEYTDYENRSRSMAPLIEF